MFRIVARKHAIKEGFEAKKVVESAAEDEDVHLQSAHDTLASRIANCKKRGEDCKAMEKRLASIKSLLDDKE